MAQSDDRQRRMFGSAKEQDLTAALGAKKQGGLVLLVLFLLAAVQTGAQLPGISLPPAEAPLPRGVKREGLTETTSVTLEGLPLFVIASQRVTDRSNPGKEVPVEIRERQIEDGLDEFLQILLGEDRKAALDERTPLEAGTNAITIETLNGQTVLVARGKGLAHPQLLLSVTPLDALAAQKTIPELAVEWRQKLMDELSETVRSRRPEALRDRIRTVQSVVIGVVLMQGLLFGINRLLLRWQKRLREAAANETTAEGKNSAAQVGVPERTFLSSHRTAVSSSRFAGREFTPRSRFKIAAFLRWLVFWGMFALWLGGVAICLMLFPATRIIAAYLLATPLMIVGVLFVAGLINRITDLMLEGFIGNWRGNQFGENSGREQIEARVTTISGVVRALKFFCIYAVALVWIVSRLEVVPWSLVTISAAGALAVSFAVQSLIKDAVMGILILVENQFALGDQVTIGDTTGIVEYMNLRITRIRATDGRLVTLPNNLIAKVENLSRSWAVSTVEFDVPLSANADQVLEEVRRLAAAMAKETEWQDIIMDANKWSGVSRISHDAMTMVIAVQTKPAQQGAVGRELRRRIKNALDAQGIDWHRVLDSADPESD